MMKKSGRDGRTAVVVGTVTDDLRLLKVPKLKVRRLSESLNLQLFQWSG